MKKAAFNISIQAIVVLILAITILGLGLTFLRNMFGTPNKFGEVELNEDKEVCLNGYMFQEDWELPAFNYTRYKELEKEGKGEFICTKKRTKTFCEFCLDDWTIKCEQECECEEWKTEVIPMINTTYTQSCYFENGEIRSEITINRIYDSGYHFLTKDIISQFVWNGRKVTCYRETLFEKEFNITKDTNECLSSRPKNECEKGNPNYVCSLYRIYSKDSSWFGGKGSHLYTKEAFEHHKNDEWIKRWNCEKCRKKTDVELFKEKINGYDCKKLLLDFTEDCWRRCKYNYYDEEGDDELKEIFILKNCEVK